ncbi:MAG: IS110 family transposase [Acidimicrobiales bacterium]|nr:IS110 family transposase [Acidimicrobiales bacterium]
MTIVEVDRRITGGVDTHLDVNVAAALDDIGGLLGVESFATTVAGNEALIAWLDSFGCVDLVGVEGTGSYGASLARALARRGVPVVEVDQPNRQRRRQAGKSDPIDAVEAARAAQGGRASGLTKSRTGNVEAIRALNVARRSARSMRVNTMNQIRHLGFTAPDDPREHLAGVHRNHLGATAAALRPRVGSDPVMFATKTSMRILGRRIQHLDAEIKELDALLAELVAATAPELLALYGVGTDTATLLLIAAGDNPERLRSEAAWAHMCGVSPIQASSGKTTRHRLNRSGDRQANHALWRITLTRMGSHDETKRYVARRLEEGKTKREIMRILKRYIAREVYKTLPRN